MTQRVRWKTLLLPLALAAAAGWLTGHHTSGGAAGDTGQRHSAVERDAAPSSSEGTGQAADASAGIVAAPLNAAAFAADLERILKGMEGAGDDDAANSGMVALRALAVVVFRLQTLRPEELDAVIAEFPENGRDGMRETLPLIMQMFGAVPADEEDFVAGLAKAGGTGTESLMLQKWGAQNPAAALAYWEKAIAGKNPPSWLKDAAPGLFNTVSQSDAREAVRAALAVPDEKVRGAALSQITLHNFYSGPKSAWPADGGGMLGSIAKADPGAGARSLGYALTARLKQESPAEALEWIASLNLGANSKKWSDRALAAAWSRKDPAASADWLLSRAAPEDRPGTAENIVREWTLMNLSPDTRRDQPEPDIGACAEWLQRQGVSAETESGVAVLADAWIEAGEPAAALAWALTMPDPAHRGTTLEKITGQLRLRYPDTWRLMLREAGAPEPAAQEP